MRYLPKELQYLQILSQRKKLNKEEGSQLRNLKKGYIGETWLDQEQLRLTGRTIFGMDDLDLRTDRSRVQIDKLLVAGDTAYVVDVKNYSGKYVLEGNQWTINGKILQKNILEQLHNAVRAIKRIFDKEDIVLNVQGVLVFIGPNSEITVLDEITDQIVTRENLSMWLVALEQKARTSTEADWQHAIAKEIIKNFPCKRKFKIDQMKDLNKGVHCRKCGSYHLMETSYAVVCLDCGEAEPKETAYTRTVCECGVLFHDRDLSLGLLRDFFGVKANISCLRKVLKKHFRIKNRAGRSSTYYNKGCLFEYWFKDEMAYFRNLEKRVSWQNRKNPYEI